MKVNISSCLQICESERSEIVRIHRYNVPGNNILVLPANLVGETADSAVLASWLQAEDTESLWDNHALDLVVWGWDTLKDLKSLHGGSTTSSLVWDHTTDSLVEDAGWSAEVEWSTTGWVVAGHLAEVRMVLHCTSDIR